MLTDQNGPQRADSSNRRSPWRWLVVLGVGVVVVVLAAYGLFVLGHVTEDDIPTFPSLIEDPDPSLQGTVAYVGGDGCVRVVPVAGGPSREVLCMPPFDPEKAAQEGKPIGPQLVWLPDGRLEVTMVNMSVGKSSAGKPPDYRPAWQKIVDVRTGTVIDVPAAQVTTDLDLGTRPVVSPSGERISFTSDRESGRVVITLTDAAGNQRTLLMADGPGEYTYGLRAAFWAPDFSYVVADDGRILIITDDDRSVTRTLVDNPNVFGDDPRAAGFAVTAQNLL